jgi:DNA-binding CsgD family transcriptional regulator
MPKPIGGSHAVRMSDDPPEVTLAKASALTPAEQSVLDHALTGAPAREIAERLSVSEATVRSHLSSIYLKLGVSGRVALLAHFRGSEAGGGEPAESPPSPRSLGVSVAGWSWGVLAVLEGAYAVYLVSSALAYGASQTTWLLIIGFGILSAFSTRLAYAIRDGPSRKLLAVSLAAAAGHLAFAVRGMFIGPEQPFLILGAMSIAIGWISFRAMRSLQD